MTKIRKTALLIILITIGLYGSLIFYGDTLEFSKYVSQIDYSYLPIILFLMIANLFFLGLRFYRLLKILKIKISLKKSILIYFASLSLLSTPIGSGQIIKSHLIKKETSEPISKTAPILLIEKWNELNSVLLILAILLLFNFFIESQIIIAIGVLISISIYGIVQNKKLFTLFKIFSEKIKFIKSLRVEIENSKESLNSFMTFRSFIEGFIFTTPAKLLEGLSVFFAFKAIGIDLSFQLSTQIFFTSVASGFLSLIPGGIIVTEGSMLGLLNQVGVDFALATAAIIFVRLTTIWFATILGLLTVRFT
jgi:glycosyltransferase 2 family protein